MILPPALCKGSRLAVIAPSGPFDRALLFRAMGWISPHFKLVFEPGLFARDGLFAGSDHRRRAELERWVGNPDVDALVVARGGHGLIRITSAIDWGALRERPAWLVGFSDATLLHLEAWKAGVASLHAANLASLGRSDLQAREAWLKALMEPMYPRTLEGQSWTRGRVRGPLVGGNLTLLFAASAARRLELPSGCILAIEDIQETSYRVDRMLASLKIAGHFDKVAGFAVGEFTDCSAGPHGVPTNHVLRSELLPLGVPVVAELPFGHGRNNQPLLIGPDAELDGSTGTLRLGNS